jgi:DNA-binding NtrC family response regulator
VTWLHAHSAYEAIEILEEEARTVALIVSDHRMTPGRSGTELLREVGERWPNVKRMLLTSWLDGAKAELAAEYDYEALGKDLDAAYLIDRICRLSRGLP